MIGAQVGDLWVIKLPLHFQIENMKLNLSNAIINTQMMKPTANLGRTNKRKEGEKIKIK